MAPCLAMARSLGLWSVYRAMIGHRAQYMQPTVPPAILKIVALHQRGDVVAQAPEPAVLAADVGVDLAEGGWPSILRREGLHGVPNAAAYHARRGIVGRGGSRCKIVCAHLVPPTGNSRAHPPRKYFVNIGELPKMTAY